MAGLTPVIFHVINQQFEYLESYFDGLLAAKMSISENIKINKINFLRKIHRFQ